ncbi:MAG: tricarballylate utilization 4Fe-4S protein TcuB [Acidobacteria bacterium]|nr:tricarballylate utilization 4Fe-4S protein TcuB [Acidobacteriota bacterium]
MADETKSRDPRQAGAGRQGAVQFGAEKDLIQEGERIMRLCNACRYCEGYCAVFPAMERRLAFPEGDLNYLANLCHNCSECYYACPYTPPHEFALNVPRTFAEIRAATYRKYAWPGLLAILFRRNGLKVAASTILGSALFLIALLAMQPAAFFEAHQDSDGAFYAVMPHTVMTATFSIASIIVVLVLAAGVFQFWRDTGGGGVGLRGLGQAMADSLRLRYLEGGGDGCAYPAEGHSHARRWFHHFTFYGFILCFAATTVAAFYHYFWGWLAPYPFWSAPVLLGTVGGIGLLIGPVGLLWLRRGRNPETGDPQQSGMDIAFLVLLFVTSITGLLLLVLRETTAMGVLLAVHLGAVMGLFVTMPYGKFVHATYRIAALVRNAQEKQQQAPRPH